LKTLYNYTSHQVPFDVFEENILKITELCSYKIFAERLSPKWDPETPYPKPPESNSQIKLEKYDVGSLKLVYCDWGRDDFT